MKNPDFLKKKDSARSALLATKIDLTAFLTWFIENYPESLRIMKEDPGVQERFR